MRQARVSPFFLSLPADAPRAFLDRKRAGRAGKPPNAVFLSRAASIIAFLFLLCASGRALAQAPSPTYEKERTDLVLKRLGFTREPRAEGRTIAFIRIEQQDVFVKDEFWPTWFNIFHWLTEEDVIRRELLFREGEPYQERKIQESARNLRDLEIFALVSITPVKVDKPGQVGVVVHTRDLWSLRLEFDWQFTGSRFDYLLGQLTERNLLGRNKAATVRFQLQPLTFSLGEAYSDRRLFGSDLSLIETFDLIFNRDSGKVEGSQGSLNFGKPFYDLDQRWSYTLSASYADQIQRDEKGGKVRTIPITDPETGEVEDIPRAYHDRSVDVRAQLQYRRGHAYKQTFSAGAGFRDRKVAPARETNLKPDQQQEFAQNVLPFTRRELFPFAGYELFLPRYAVLENLATYGQSESVRTGPGLWLTFELPLQAYGSSTDSLTAQGEFRYLWADCDALAEAALRPSARWEEGRAVDQFLGGELRGAAPAFLIGRLVFRGVWEARRADTGNTTVTLGGDNGLRGYPSRWFQEQGGSLVRANLEYRTLPLKWQSVHLGAALFYDLGSVYRRLDRIDLHSDAGFGLRLLFPQFAKQVFRFDLGIPLDRRCCRPIFSFAYGQAVPLTAAEEVTVK